MALSGLKCTATVWNVIESTIAVRRYGPNIDFDLMSEVILTLEILPLVEAMWNP